MKLAQTPSHRSDGRLRGSYVYLLLCYEAPTIHVKAGRSDDPVKRLQGVLITCPIEPGLLATCELPSRTVAARAEAALHRAFRPWHTRGEWFRFEPNDREVFNAAWRGALAEFASPSWPVRWTKLSLRPLLAQSRSTQRFQALVHTRRRHAGLEE